MASSSASVSAVPDMAESLLKRRKSDWYVIDAATWHIGLQRLQPCVARIAGRKIDWDVNRRRQLECMHSMVNGRRRGGYKIDP